MTPTVVVGGLLAVAYAMIRRWERLQRRDGMREPAQERQPEPAPRRSLWARVVRRLAGGEG